MSSGTLSVTGFSETSLSFYLTTWRHILRSPSPPPPKKKSAEKLCNVHITLANLVLTVYSSLVFDAESQKLLHVSKQRAKTRYIIHV